MTFLMGAATLFADADLDWNGHMSGGWWIFMAIGAVLFWGLVILAIVWLVRELQRPRHAHGGHAPDPTAVLDQRLAAGEITPDEYRERVAVLRGEDD